MSSEDKKVQHKVQTLVEFIVNHEFGVFAFDELMWLLHFKM